MSVVERLSHKELEQSSNVLVTQQWRHLAEGKRNSTSAGKWIRCSVGDHTTKHVKYRWSHLQTTLRYICGRQKCRSTSVILQRLYNLQSKVNYGKDATNK